jgi:sialate O-acetylesterase
MFQFLLCAALQNSTLKLNTLFSDGMVLQRDAVDPVFGVAAPGASVQVTINGQTGGTRADSAGNWQAQLNPLPVGGPYVMKVVSGAETVTVQDIEVGEVWLASGQSNMEFTEDKANDYFSAQTATKSDVRMFIVKKATSDRPLSNEDGQWDAASPATVGRFSAVGVAFARELEQKLHVPVGIILASWGGTPAEAWTSKEALQRDPATEPLITRYLADLPTFDTRKAAYDEAMQLWIDGKKGGENQGFLNGWAAAEFNDADWQTVPAATLASKILGRDVSGSFWYRKTIQIPDAWYGKALRLELGTIDTYDNTYVNGVRVGRTDDKTIDAATVSRIYPVAPGIVRRGSNTIAVRVFSDQATAGMSGPDNVMKIGPVEGEVPLSLDSEWKFKVEQELDPNAPRPHLPMGPGNPNAPTQLFNAMIAPLMPYQIKGAIWYQGEANVGRAAEYSHLFPTMIRDWRARWGEGLFPFYFVQLSNYLARKDEPGDSAWAELREAQGSALSLPHTGEAVIIDIGEAGNIHPKNKKEVGRRLALLALANAYEQPVYFASPTYASTRFDGATATVTFDNGSLTTTDDQPPRGFALAGKDGVFHWAQARIDGSAVILTSPDVMSPVAARYGWADNPDVNLVNHAGLPARPFRTDGPTLK